MLFHRVLVPVDLSEVSLEQLECALQLRHYGMKEMLLLFVLATGPEPSVKEKAKLQQLVDRAIEQGVTVRSMVELGKASTTILKVAKKEKVTLILMASSGKTKRTELLMGSVSLEVVRRTQIPVLVGKFFNPKDKRKGKECPLLLERVLISLDLGPCTKSLMTAFKDIDGAGAKKAVLFHVVQSSKYSVEDDAKFQQVKQDLAKWKAHHKGGCEMDTHLHYGTPAYNIMEAAREFDVTLIVMGNVGKGLLHAMTLGSVSDEVLRKSPVHVMIVPC